jgi:hypothetical protein
LQNKPTGKMGIVEIIPPYLYSMQYDNEPLDEYHRVFRDKYIYEWKLIPMKGYGTGKPTFIRLYAIRMEENCYLMVYGGLKSADTIQNSPVLKTEVFKRIDQTLAYLKREGITEQEDLKEEDV